MSGAIDLHVAGGLILVVPHGKLPPRLVHSAYALSNAVAMARIQRSAAALAELRREWRFLGLAADVARSGEPRMIAALETAVQRHQLDLFWLPTEGAGATVTPSKPRPSVPASVAQWTAGEKIGEALRRALTSRRIGKILREQLESLLEPANIAIALGFMLLLAIPGADVPMLALAYAVAGWSGLIAMVRFGKTTFEVAQATDQAGINAAADAYAHELVDLGEAIISRLLIRVKLRAATAAKEEQAATQAAKATAKAEQVRPTPAPPKPVAQVGSAEVAASPVNKPVYRIDGRPPGTIFKEGFQPKGTSTDLKGYVDTNSPSAFVSTSKTPAIANNPDFAKPGTYLYQIDGSKIAGIDVNKAYPANPFAHEAEVAVMGGVPRAAIISAKPVLPGGGLGNAIPNPFYTGGK